jgi:ATP-dependent protease HslVU (ClpYQ) peptidase subunit
MTVIAYDGKTISADKRATSGGLIRTVTKLHKLSDGSIFAHCGDSARGLEMLEWLKAGSDIEKFPADQRHDDKWGSCIWLKPDGLFVYEMTPHPLKFEDKCLAFGSGREFALAAMHCGKTSAEAVEIASLFDNGCGNGIDTMSLEG